MTSIFSRATMRIVLLCLVMISSVAMASSPIKNFLAIMIENRSFDHRLGWLKQLGMNIDGLTGEETNPIDPNDLSKGYCKVTNDGDPYGTPDAGHSYPSTCQEQFGKEPFQPGVPPMNGFILASDPSWGCDVMRTIPVDDIPVSRALLENFAVVDHWFPGFPGPTEVNRMFYHSATSNGFCANPNDATYVEGYDWESTLHRMTQNNVTWKVYMYEDVSTTLFFKDQRRPEALENYHNISRFFKDVAEGNLAQYSIIEPRYTPTPEHPANDEHPSDHSIYAGESMFKEIYEALRAGPQWNTSALLITYDEHGGLYDHVPSPNGDVPSPTPNLTCTFEGDPNFKYDRLGIRVPAFVISPWVPKGSVISAPKGPYANSQFEHSSVSATLHDLFDTDGFLTARDAWAGSLGPFFSLSAPRTDCPETLPTPPRTARIQQKLDQEPYLPLNDFQQSLVRGYAAMSGDLHFDPLSLGNQYEATLYLKAAWARFREQVAAKATMEAL